MAYKVFDNYSDSLTNNTSSSGQHEIILDSESGKRVELPDTSYVTDADMLRDGMDLALQTPDGTIIVKGYFAAEPTPHLVAPDGTALTPTLVESFVHDAHQYADAGQSTNDVTPVGAVQEIAGEATVTRLDGTVEVVGIGTPIYQGDVIETDEKGAVNIMFVDETTFAVSEDARLAIDEYVFDPATQSGTTNFSVLKGVFVFTSGLIGREDPDDVSIDTPSGSIGIRGTIIAGDVDSGEITVIEGAIVLYDFAGNTITLSNQYETAKFNPSGHTIDHVGELSADDVASKFMSVSTVAADLFSSIQDSAAETQDNSPQTQTDTDDKGASATDGNDSNTQTADASASPDNIITSDDITGSDLNTQNSDETELSDNTSNDSDDSNEAANVGSDSGGEDAYEVVSENTPDTPFSISVTKLSFSENVNGQDVARITGNATDLTNLTLMGTSKNYYDIIREDDNSFLISLKAGVSIDAEDPFALFINASNESGSATISQGVGLNVLNIDEPITYTALAPNVSGLDNNFSGSQDSVLTYDMSLEFSDPEDQITSYSFVGGAPTHADIASVNLDANGQLTLTLDNNVTADSSFTFTVRADTGGGEILDHTFTYDIFGQTTSSAVIVSNSQTYSGNDASITIAANNANVFSDIDNSSNIINLAGNNAYIKTGGGDDTVTINTGSSNYHVYGDSGNDTFVISEMQGKSYGGEGNDRFEIITNTAMGDLESLSVNVVIEGGDGSDTLEFGILTSGNINFSNITTGFIENIEVLDFDGGIGHTIDLHYNNVISMTDSDNRLIIDMDAGDTLNFNNTSSNDFVQAQNTIDVNGDTYNVFTDGTITLLVDVDGSANGIIA
tara:strand:+ start:11232 stop:13769 length:2538 start_codon:yes stop_codon:yes gene_type:complete